MDLFNTSEDYGRERAIKAIKSILKDGYEIKSNSYKDRVDFTIYKDGEVNSYIEVKHRNVDLGTYPDYQLDGRKAMFLLTLDKPTFYLNTFKDGSWVIWRINNQIGEWRESKPHYAHTVLCDEKVVTKDLFLKLNEAYGFNKAVQSKS